MQARPYVVVMAAVVLTCGLLPVLGQTSAPAASPAAGSTGTIDPAVLAKASSGDDAAQVQAGESYAHAAAAEQDRDQMDEDYKQAGAWFRKAADQGNIAGELQLAALYRDGGGKGFARDAAQAAVWYGKAADQGDASAQGTLGLLYAMGQGVPRSDVDAYFWLDMAASVPGPRQAQYAANRQMIGARLTTDDLDTIHEREKHWKAAHAKH